MRAWLFALLTMGCGGDKGTPTDPADTDTDTDTDTDADTDSDTDTDTDADTDTDTDTDADTDTDPLAEPTCADATVLPLTLTEYERLVVDKFCWWWDNGCGSGDCPATAGTGTSGTLTKTNCDFDPVAACDCLDDPWQCNTDFPGFYFPEVAPSCLVVCGEGGSGR